MKFRCLQPTTYNLQPRSGFTLVEAIVVVALMLVIGTAIILNLSGQSRGGDVDLTIRKAAALLRDANARARGGDASTAWGVRFDNTDSAAPFYALFASSAYAANATVGYYRLPPSVSYNTSMIPAGTARDVVFEQITGMTSSATVGFIGGIPFAVGTITVAPSGLVAY